MERARMPHLPPGQRHPDWNQVYESAAPESLPWHTSELDPDFRLELNFCGKKGMELLDVGCGLGYQADLIAKQGFAVTATDISPAAIRRARIHFPEVRFLVDDITRSRLNRSFDLTVDRGCFHVLGPSLHGSYCDAIQRLTKPRGIVLLKILSSENPASDFGPLRFSLLGIHRLFGARFRVLRIRRTVYQGSTPTPPKAWLVVLRNS